MEWFQSPVILSVFLVYVLLMLLLSAIYLRGSSSRAREDRAAASATGGSSPQPKMYSAEGVEVVSMDEDHVDLGVGGEPNRQNREQLIKEADRLFASDKEPVFVTDENLNVIYRNRAARKVFGTATSQREEPFFAALGAEEKSVRKQLSGQDRSTSASIPCLLPNGRQGTAQVGLAILNRMPRVNALRVTGLEEEKPSWLTRGGKGAESTSLTRGGHLDFREVDPASVELSADQMLAPLREIDDLLARVHEAQRAGDTEAGKRGLQPARNKLRRLIRHIEEIDWMLQVTDGHLHLRPENFKAYEVLSAMAEAANRLSSAECPRLKLDPEEAPLVEPTLSGDRRIFEKVITQLLTSAFRAGGAGDIRAFYSIEALENPAQSDDWHLFAGEGEARSEASLLTIRIGFQRPEQPANGSDLPAVVETLGSQIMDPRMTKRLDFVKKGRDSDLFGLTLARELVGKLDGELIFQSDANGRSEFVLRLKFENAA